MMVQCRVTGVWYDPQVEFARLLCDPEIVALLKRLKER